MADTSCNGLIQDLQPGCLALNKVGGLDKRVWAIQKKYLSVTYDSAGYVNSIALSVFGSITQKLLKFISKRDKVSATWAMTVGENVNTWNHALAIPLYTSNPTEVLAIEQLANADDVVVFVQENADVIRVLGLGKGLNGSAGEGGSGTLLNDNTGYLLTLSGEEMNMPKYFSINGSIATISQNIAYLDALSL